MLSNPYLRLLKAYSYSLDAREQSFEMFFEKEKYISNLKDDLTLWMLLDRLKLIIIIGNIIKKVWIQALSLALYGFVCSSWPFLGILNMHSCA